MFASLLLHAGATVAALLPIVNPLAAAAAFYSLTAHDPPARRSREARLSTVYTIAILIVALFAGKAVLRFFGISLGVLEIAGGLLVGYTGWSMVTRSPTQARDESEGEEIAFTPMAMPLLAGPGAIGVTIALSVDLHSVESYTGAVAGIIVIGAIVLALLQLGGPLQRLLGTKGINAITRILGFFILAIGVALAAEGVADLARSSGEHIGVT